jgi:hypothetical protein
MWDLNFGTWISHRGFTVAFGHGHPLVLSNEAKHNILALAGKANKNFKSRPGTYACESLRFACAMTLWESQIIYNVYQ